MTFLGANNFDNKMEKFKNCKANYEIQNLNLFNSLH